MTATVPNGITTRLREAGVVGAGGAGFPVHVKWAARVDTVIANGAECEPLLHKDAEIIENFAAEVLDGLRLAAEATGAGRLCFGIKAKKKGAIAELEKHGPSRRVELSLLGDYYPTGDEFELVHAVTGRLIPPAGLPLEVGVVVNNVETLLNAARAASGQPVTHKFVTIAGAVARPATFRIPLGVSFGEAIEAAGGSTVERPAIFVGGVMMGRLTRDLSEPITKTTTGLILLPEDHHLVERMSRPVTSKNRIGKSACDQCSYCTELCPRYLLGYDVQPHKVMRTLGFSALGSDFWSKWGDLCCSCGLCTLYSCPEELYPKEACDQAKAQMRRLGQKWRGPDLPLEPHPMAEGRRVPLKKLEQKLGILEYEQPAPFDGRDWTPRLVRLLLKQHAGAPASPLVRPGDRVTAGQKIADVKSDQLGAPVHASIAGRVTSASEKEIVVEA
ncbi:MAG TPA: SLBB domain-containing protein [Verrucomicrobiae bacterium]|nr:SLBB domain-containing protein [Verrucomicrobiae bacterium]